MRACVSEVAQPGGGSARVSVQPLPGCPTYATVVLLAADGAHLRMLGAVEETPAGWTATPAGGGKPRTVATEWAALAALTRVPSQRAVAAR